MKYSFAIAALATAVSAQSLADVPKCAIPCLDDAITSKTDCKTTDLTCVCKSFDDVRSAATSCVITKCGSDVAINEVLPATEKLCSSGGGSGSAEESKADTTKVETSTKVAVTTSAVETTAVETTPVETTSVPPVVESKTTTVPPVIETPTTKSGAAGGASATSTPAPSSVGNGAAGLKGLGAMAMAALMALAL
ncbi:extracellular membrane CFEM domain-containing protein [Fusarium mundagurra]|uniref:Extracellular membrane CFEM domain-containing protein n=1 Tax=Fusarium mundagurra TaxID=1567541 RepID=A0A8H5YML4_9HYPO|nr:extracellular membrane CFEM domain-containing protein [Fusarium mundagurra]